MTGRREQGSWATLRKGIRSPSPVPWVSPGFSGAVQPQKPGGPCPAPALSPHLSLTPLSPFVPPGFGNGNGLGAQPGETGGLWGLVFSVSLLDLGGEGQDFLRIEGADREPSDLLFPAGSKGLVPLCRVDPKPPQFIPPSPDGPPSSEWLQNR